MLHILKVASSVEKATNFVGAAAIIGAIDLRQLGLCLFLLYSWFVRHNSILTHWGRVTQICVFILQLCKTD